MVFYDGQFFFSLQQNQYTPVWCYLNYDFEVPYAILKLNNGQLHFKIGSYLSLRGILESKKFVSAFDKLSGTEVGEMALWVMCLLCKNKDLSLGPQHL